MAWFAALFRRLAPVALMLVAVGSGATGARSAAPMSEHFDRLVAQTKAMMQINPTKALGTAHEAEAVAAHLAGQRQSIAVATAKWLEGEAYLRLNDSTHAAPLIEGALAIVADAPTPIKLTGDLLLSKGAMLTSKGDVAGALAVYQRAHNIFRDLGETRSQAIALVSIAVLYQEAEDYVDALKYNDQAVEVYRGDPQISYSIYANRGIALNQLGRTVQAQAEFGKALKLARELDSTVLEARTLRNIARSQLDAGQLAQADQTIAEGLKVSRGADALVARGHFLELSARSALKHQRYADAERLIARSFAGVNLTTTTLDMRDGHQAAYEIYHRNGNEHAALLHLEALKRLDDSMSKLSASANTSLASAKFDFANQKTRIAQLRQAQLQRDVDDAQLRARTQLTIFGGLAVATLIIVAMLAFGLVTIRRSRNEVRAANIDLASTNAALGKALAAKTEFLATTSHEIRTPLNGILGMTQVMLADSSLSAALRDRIGVVHGAGVTMRALVDDILDVAKMETGNLTIECVPFDLPATLRDVCRLWEEQAHSKGVSFTLDLADCPHHVEGDAARIRQIVFNLLSNALKFTAAGSVHVRAGKGGSDAQPTLAVTVEDSGIGIPPDKLDIIFESFRQADAGTARKFGGTGLGLAICRNLARAMDGDVTVESVAGEGSRFVLTLPLVLATAPEAAPAVGPDAAPALLILDRNPIARAMLRAVLEPRIGTVSFAGTVDEALARIASGGVARVLVDDATIKLGDVDAGLHALAATGAAVDVLWPAPTAADTARLVSTGAAQVIAKPIAGVALAALLSDPHPSEISLPTRLVIQAA